MARLVHRPARVWPPAPARTAFTIPEPPTQEEPPRPPLVQLLLPLLSSGGMVLFGFTSGSKGLLIVGGIALVGSLAAPMVMARTSRRQHAERLTRRETRYREALARLRRQITDAQRAARAAVAAVHPDLADLGTFATGPRLWERRLGDDDFLDVVVGTGDAALGITVEHTRDRVYLDAAPAAELLAAAHELAELGATLADAPTVLSLREHAVVAVSGDRAAALGLVRAMLMELGVCCGPDEVQLLVVSPPSSADDWDGLKWLPHASVSGSGGGRRGASLLAATEADALRLLTEVVQPRLRMLQEQDQRHGPRGEVAHLVLVVDEFNPLTALQELTLLWEALRHAAELSVSVVALCRDFTARPEEATVCVQVFDDGRGVVNRLGQHGVSSEIVPRLLDRRDADALARSIAPCRLVGEASRLSRVVSDRLFDLLELGDELTGPPSWAPLADDELLRVPLGSLSDGRPFELDLKESAVGGHGPHGLIVGATGSGKSELLRAAVTALVLRQSPDDLALVFSDFKGGATFDLLADVPHCAGLITNLETDLSLVDRMKAAITGELLRRQALLRLAGRDIQKIAEYRALRATTAPDLPPMPYLVLVVDEFGELLEARPDFLEVFLTLGRTGRSLGMHMMLATQRLDAGRIRGLESYLSYRLSLRTFTAEESVAAIGNRLAYELPTLPGQGYFRSGEHFSRFKAARVNVAPVGSAGAGPLVTDFGAPAAGRPASTDGAQEQETDLARAVAWLSTAKDRNAPLWLEPLPLASGDAPLMLGDARLRSAGDDAGDAGLPLPIGLLDVPARREQPPMVYDPAVLDGHLVVVGSPQSGKSTALRTIVAAAADRYSPRLLQFYGVDLSSGALGPLLGMPNVAGVALAAEPDRVRRIFAELAGLLDDRARQFRACGVESMGSWLAQVRAGRPGFDRGHVVLLLDGYLALRQRFADLEETLARLLTDGPSFGVHVAIANNRWELRPAHLESISTRVELRLNEPQESLLGRAAATAVPRGEPGRGLATGGAPVQLAAPTGDPDGLADLAARLANQATRRWPGETAAPLVMLGDLDRAAWEDKLRDVAAQGMACLGVVEQGPRGVGYDPRAGEHLHVVGDVGNGRTSLLARLAREVVGDVGGTAARLFVVDYRRDLARALGKHNVAFTGAHTPDQLTALLAELVAELTARRTAAAAHAGDDAFVSAGPATLLLVDDFELVVAGKLHPLAPVVPYLTYGRELAFSVVLAQAARGIPARQLDQLVKALVDQDATHLFFSVEARNELMSFGGRRGEVLPPHTATLVRPQRSQARVLTNLAR